MNQPFLRTTLQTTLRSIDLRRFLPLISIENDKTEFMGAPGKEHYAFLAFLSTLFNNNTIVELGTHRGSSALALSYNTTNIVHTFDIENRVHPSLKQQLPDTGSNIVFHLENMFDNLDAYSDLLLNAPLIFLDIDPHEGPMETQLYTFLRDRKYRGLLVCDDVWKFKGMRDHFWYKIPADQRYDFTEVGHFSGTGIVSFVPLSSSPGPLSLWPNMEWDNGYTLVTAYFNLTRCPDASNAIRQRDQAYYLSHAYSTLSLPCSLVVYCDEESYPLLRAIRPAYLGNDRKTKYNIREFDSFSLSTADVDTQTNAETKTFSEWRDIIQHNRESVFPYRQDPRNTPSYYLFCIARYIMLREVIRENVFGSTHFAWINVCMERMGISNIQYLGEALAAKRDKFSTCYIDYVPKSVVDVPSEYFKFGRCGMCSGFFTGNAFYMNAVCQRILVEFIKYALQGYGHADEQLYSRVYFDAPQLFEHYYGDYQQMITNYVRVREAPEAPIRNFIRNAWTHRAYDECEKACLFLYKSLQDNTCTLSDAALNQLGYYYGRSLMDRHR